MKTQNEYENRNRNRNRYRYRHKKRLNTYIELLKRLPNDEQAKNRYTAKLEYKARRFCCICLFIWMATMIMIGILGMSAPIISGLFANAESNANNSEPYIAKTEQDATQDTQNNNSSQDKAKENKATQSNKSDCNPLISPSAFKRMGVFNWGGWKWTWFAGRAIYDKDCTVDSNGFYRYKGMIVLASSTLAKGTIVDTPFGSKGIVLDTGCKIGVFDVKVNWR